MGPSALRLLGTHESAVKPADAADAAALVATARLLMNLDEFINRE
jgi:hypothetical protein